MIQQTRTFTLKGKPSLQHRVCFFSQSQYWLSHMLTNIGCFHLLWLYIDTVKHTHIGNYWFIHYTCTEVYIVCKNTFILTHTQSPAHAFWPTLVTHLFTIHYRWKQAPINTQLPHALTMKKTSQRRPHTRTNAQDKRGEQSRQNLITDQRRCGVMLEEHSLWERAEETALLPRGKTAWHLKS